MFKAFRISCSRVRIGLIGVRSRAFGASRDVRLLGLVLWVQVLGFRV